MEKCGKDDRENKKKEGKRGRREEGKKERRKEGKKRLPFLTKKEAMKPSEE